MGYFLLHIITFGAINCFQTIGYNVVFGKGKILHFGQVAQTLLFSYTLWVLVKQFEYSYFSSVLAAITITILLGAGLAWLSFRLTPDGLGVMSIAIHLALLAVVQNWTSVTRGQLGIVGIPKVWLPTNPVTFAITTIITLLIWVTVLMLLNRSQYGRQIAALAENEWHAEALGIRRRKTHLIAFLLSAVGSILTGLFFVPFLGLLTPSNFHFPAMIFIVLCTIAGGPGSVLGVTIATMLIVAAKEAIRLAPLSPDMSGPAELLLFAIILFIAVWRQRDSLFPSSRLV